MNKKIILSKVLKKLAIKKFKGVRGVISPEGVFHPIPINYSHYDKIIDLWHGEKSYPSVEDRDKAFDEAYKEGWLMVGVGGDVGEWGIGAGEKKYLEDKYYPATKKLRELMKKNWSSPYFDFWNKHWDTEIFIKHGVLEEYLKPID